MNKQAQASSGGIGLTGLLLLVFIALKLTGHITWAWPWVLAPLWMPAVALTVIALVALVVAIVFGVVTGEWRK